MPPQLLGVYLNPDDIEQGIRDCGFLDLSSFHIFSEAHEIIPFFTGSPFLISAGIAKVAEKLAFEGNRLDFGDIEVNSYFASVAVDFIRQKLLERNLTFTIETVILDKFA